MEPYTGNDELDALPNQTMYDAFDAVIFLAPIEKQRQSAAAISIYTPEFLRELSGDSGSCTRKRNWAKCTRSTDSGTSTSSLL